MSLFADILVLAALVAAAWLGARRGLLKSLAGLLIVLVALWGASWAADHLTEPVAQWIEPRVTQRVERKLEESHAADAGQMLQAFSFRGSGLQKMLDAVHQRVQQTGETVIRAVAQSIARSVAGTAVYVVVFLILLVLLWRFDEAAECHCHQAPTGQHRQRLGRSGPGSGVRRPYAVCGRMGHAALWMAHHPGAGGKDHPAEILCNPHAAGAPGDAVTNLPA